MIWEDPDELGYFQVPDDELVDPPEFRWLGKIHGGYPGGVPVPPPDSLQVCNRILLKGEQQAIRSAANLTHAGHFDHAERHRARTDYAGFEYREHVDAPGHYKYAQK